MEPGSGVWAWWSDGWYLHRVRSQTKYMNKILALFYNPSPLWNNLLPTNKVYIVIWIFSRLRLPPTFSRILDCESHTYLYGDLPTLIPQCLLHGQVDNNIYTKYLFLYKWFTYKVFRFFLLFLFPGSWGLYDSVWPKDSNS